MNVLVWALICCASLSCANKKFEDNYFEGTVTYTLDIVSKNSKLDSSTLKALFGNSETLFFKEGNFLHKFNGGLFKEDLYRKDDNKVYLRKNGNDTTFWTDCGSAGDEILRFSLAAKKEKILGIDCDELVIYYKDKTVSDYYNSDSLSINPEWLKNYVLDGEYLTDQKEKAIFLKQKTEYNDFVIIQTASGFFREKLDDSIFKIAPGEILAKQQ